MSGNRYRWTGEFGIRAMPTTKNLTIPITPVIGTGHPTAVLTIPAAEIGAFLRASQEVIRELAALVAAETAEAEKKAAERQGDTP